MPPGGNNSYISFLKKEGITHETRNTQHIRAVDDGLVESESTKNRKNRKGNGKV